MPDFFVSYTKTDEQWAEWVSWILEEAGYSVTVQAWDFGAGGNFILEMQRAAAEAPRTIAILSPEYLHSGFARAEWAAAFAADPVCLFGFESANFRAYGRRSFTSILLVLIRLMLNAAY